VKDRTGKIKELLQGAIVTKLGVNVLHGKTKNKIQLLSKGELPDLIRLLRCTLGVPRARP